MTIARLYRVALRILLLNDISLIAIMAVLFFARAFWVLDPDFGWHIASGQYILEHGIPATDIYSYTMPTFSWIHHEWLSDCLNYLVYHYLGGYGALAVLYAALWTASFWLVSRGTQYRLVVVLAAVVALPFSGVRAVTWTVFFCAILISLVYSRRRRHVLALIPPLFLIWANMHGSFVIGLVYLAWQTIARRSRRLAVITACSILATMVTPYGPLMYVEVVRTIADTSLRSRISEWQALGLAIGPGLLTGLWLGLRSIQPGSWITKYGRFELLLLVMSFGSVRHLPIFALFTIASINRMTRHYPLSMKRPRIPVQRFAIAVVVLALASIGILCTSAYYGQTGDREHPYPRQIAQSLHETPCRGNVFAHYNFGGYLIWRVPDQKLYIDGRMPSWQQGSFKAMDTYLQIIDDPAVQQEQFTRYNIACVVWHDNTPFVHRLESQGWTVVEREPNTDIVRLER